MTYVPVKKTELVTLGSGFVKKPESAMKLTSTNRNGGRGGGDSSLSWAGDVVVGIEVGKWGGGGRGHCFRCKIKA